MTCMVTASLSQHSTVCVQTENLWLILLRIKQTNKKNFINGFLNKCVVLLRALVIL